MNINQITDQLRNFAHDELIALAGWCESEARKKSPAEIARKEAESQWLINYKQRQAEALVKFNKALFALRDILKPGMMLKVKGAKDGQGIREFIRWDGDDLVCWQISRSQQWNKTGMGDKGHYTMVEKRTNQVTTHMPDKVQQITIGGVPFPVKSLFSTISPAVLIDNGEDDDELNR